MAKKATNKMTGRPSKAAEASVASSIAAPKLNGPEDRWQFVPPPKYSAAWWQEHFHEHRFADSVNFTPGVLNPESWIVTWAFGLSIPCLMDGYWPTPFPTATDVLLWLRLHVLPQVGSDPASIERATKIIERIDAAPTGTDSATLLKSHKPALTTEFPAIAITSICSVHEWLSGQGTQAEFRKCYGTGVISCQDGRWTMPQAMWDIIVADLSDWGGEGLSLEFGGLKAHMAEKIHALGLQS